MPKFNKGDKVRVRLTSHSPYRDQIGVVDDNPSMSSSGFWYMVRFEWKGLRPAARFTEEELEAITDEVIPEETPAPVEFTKRPRWNVGNKITQVSTKKKYLLIALTVVLALTAILVVSNIGTRTNPPTPSGLSSTPAEVPLLTGESSNETMKLAFATELVGATAGSAFPIQPVVKIEDANGDIMTTSTAPVTLTVANNRAMLYGTRTVNAVNGIATFTDLSIRLVGPYYSLMATSPGATPALSNSFNVAPSTAAKLVFIKEPVASGLASRFSVEVAILDAYGNIVTDSTAEVTLSITPGSGTTGATLSGATTRRATEGVATFSYLSISPESSNYKLTATSPSLTSATTRSFNPAKITESQAR